MGYTSYNFPGDIVTPVVTVQTGTDDSNFPATNTVNFTNRKFGYPGKLLEIAGAWLADFGVAQRVDRFVLQHNFDDGMINVRLQGNATNVWTSPSFSQLIPIGNRREDGYTYKSVLDLPLLSGYNPSGYRYWRLYVPTLNSVPVGVKMLFLSTIRTLESDAIGGLRLTEVHDYIDLPTDTGFHWTYDLLGAARVYNATFGWSAAMDTVMRSLFRALGGRSKFTVWIPDTRVNDAWLVRLLAAPGDQRDSVNGLETGSLTVQVDDVTYRTVQFAFEEMTAGGPEWL